jgi:UDP-3-O-[3-hydroxymyristoyl] N-acetylglucosamine deacetylase
VVADRAGHAMHTALVSRLLRDRALWEETMLSEIERDTYSHSDQHTAVQNVN